MNPKQNYSKMYEQKESKEPLKTETTEPLKTETTEPLETETTEPLETETTEAVEQQGVVINCELVNVRKNPSTFSQVLCVLKAGSPITVKEILNDWFRVETTDGIDGYIMSAYIARRI